MTDIASLGLEIRSDGVVVAKDRLRAFGEEADRSTSRAQTVKRAWTMSLAAVTAAAAAFGIGIAGAVKRMEDMRRMSAQVDQALRNSGNSARTSAMEIAAWADQLEAATGRQAEEIMSVSANLASFGFSRQAFFRSLALADDMSAAWGGDLRQNLEGLARALAEPEKGLAMLTKRGITFTEEQKKMIAGFIEVNDLAGAQGVVFEALEAQVKGVAEQGFGGLTKAIAQGQKAWEDAFERLVAGEGDAADLRESLEDLARVVSSPEFIGAMMAFGNVIIRVIDGIAQVAVGAHKAIQDLMGIGGPGAVMPEGGTTRNLFPQDYGNAEADIRRQFEWSWRNGTPLGGGVDPYAGFSVGQNGQFNMQATLGNVGGGFDGFNPYEGMDLGGGDGGKKAARMAEAYRDLTRGAREFIAEQQLEAQTLGMTEEAASRLRHEQDLLNQAANDNIALTPKMRGELADLATQMAAAEEAARRLNEIYEFGKGVFSSFFGDVRSGIEEGKSLWESLGQAATNALDSIASKALEMAANGIWDMLFGAVMGGISGGLGAGGPGFLGGGASSWGPSFAGGGYTGMGARAGGVDGMGGFPAILHPNETVIDHTLGGSNDNGGITINNVINVPAGTTADVAPAIAREVTKQIRQQGPAIIEAYNRNPHRRAS